MRIALDFSEIGEVRDGGRVRGFRARAEDGWEREVLFREADPDAELERRLAYELLFQMRLRSLPEFSSGAAA